MKDIAYYLCVYRFDQGVPVKRRISVLIQDAISVFGAVHAHQISDDQNCWIQIDQIEGSIQQHDEIIVSIISKIRIWSLTIDLPSRLLLAPILHFQESLSQIETSQSRTSKLLLRLDRSHIDGNCAELKNFYNSDYSYNKYEDQTTLRLNTKTVFYIIIKMSTVLFNFCDLYLSLYLSVQYMLYSFGFFLGGASRILRFLDVLWF